MPTVAQDALPKGQPNLRLVTEGARPAGPRLAAIVVADMVDYTRHMAADEAGTHARYAVLRHSVIEPGLAKHGARLIKHTGDGFLAEFPSATWAVWFAIRFQKAVRTWNARRSPVRRIEFRVGINLGDVIGDASDVFGHSVNVAARLEGAASPGGVLVSYAVFTSVRDPRLRFEDAGILSLKSIEEPLHGFHVKSSTSHHLSGTPPPPSRGGWGEQRDSNP